MLMMMMMMMMMMMFVFFIGCRPSRSRHGSPSTVQVELPPALMAGGGEGSSSVAMGATPLSQYETQKSRDWNAFLQYLNNHKPPLHVSRCSGAHVLEFLGKTKVHVTGCPYFGHPNQPGPCACPLKQAWGSLNALIGRLKAAYEENGGRAESNPFGTKAVRIYMREVRDGQARARWIVPYGKNKKKRKRLNVSSSEATTGEGLIRQEGLTGEGGDSVGGASS